MNIKIRIKRFNPSDAELPEPYVQAYNVEVTEGMTVLEVLLKIADTQDPSLSFRRSCRSAICGSCAMKINGFTKLACSTQVLPEWRKRGDIMVEPMANHPVLKDLIVDFDPFWKKMNRVEPFLTPTSEFEAGREDIEVTREDEGALDRAQSCIMCGSCNSECNALEIDKRFVAPAALAKAWRFAGDPRESRKKKRLEDLSGVHGMWDCVRCVHCTEYCPKDVRPLKAIERLRAKAMEELITDNPGAKHVEAMVDSVKKHGRLDEAAMTFKTLGFLRSFGMIPLGLKMEVHGKMPLPHIFPQIDKIEEVRKIYEQLGKDKDKRKKGGGE